MTKEITKAILLQEMQDKLKLRDLIPAKFTFEESVVPVYEIAPHLVAQTIKQESEGVTSSTNILFYTVPGDEVWTLHRYNVIFVTGVYTVAGVIIGRPAISSSQYIYLDLAAGQSVSYLTSLKIPVRLESGDKIYVYVDDYTSSGNLELWIDIGVEKIR